MRLQTVPLDQALGHIVRHNVADAAGRKAIAKGRRLDAADVARLAALGYDRVRVAILDPDDVAEDDAAEQLAAAVTGAGLRRTAAVHSRVNLVAAEAGVLRIAVAALGAINAIDGLTIATRRDASTAQPGDRVATIKVIPFAVPAATVQAALALAPGGGVVALQPFRPCAVAVILVGSPTARRRVEQALLPAIEARVAAAAGQVAHVRYVAHDEAAVAAAVAEAAEHAALVIVAGETSIMDRDDITPLGIRAAGATIEHYGAPVEPGNLLLLAYLTRADRTIPVLGAPGCVRSRDINIVDLVLPRLMTGERVRRSDIIALGHGGLLA
jgi:molybdopterin biosynthesis enzyme